MRLGIDLGGTKIEIIALDEDGNTLHRQRTEFIKMLIRGLADKFIRNEFEQLSET